MLESLIALDHTLFLQLNGAHADWLDPIMAFCSGKLTWIPFYLLIIFLVYRACGWRKTLWFILGVALAILLADQLSVHLFKNTIQRLRPSHNPLLEDLVYLPTNHRGGLYGFVSSHAANCFAVTIVGTRLIRASLVSGLLWLWACIVSYSRIYMGVHFPGDVICGALFGVLIGLLVVHLVRMLYRLTTHNRWQPRGLS